MSGNQLFPKEIIDNSAEVNFQKHSLKTKLIYVTTLLFIVTSGAALPFIYVDVSVRSPGIIKPITDRNQLKAPVSGKIKHLYIQENTPIEKGETVAVIATPLIDEKLDFNTHRQEQLTKYLRDLSVLQNIDSASVFKPFKLATPQYRRSLIQLKQQVRSSINQVEKTTREFQRNRELFKRGMISESAYEQTTFELQSVRSDLQLLFEQQLNKWQSEQITYRSELDQLMAEEEQLLKEREQYIVKAPISGTIQNMQGVYEGSTVTPGQPLAEISPDTGLIAECYIPPKDIGLIKKGMKARIQVSAFNYNQWGILTGEVQEVSNDVIMVKNKPVFVVHSKLDQTYLSLKNGYKGKLKKGMTLQARFTITRRSLFQLLYDNVNDWLNPNWGQPAQRQQASM